MTARGVAARNSAQEKAMETMMRRAPDGVMICYHTMAGFPRGAMAEQATL